VPVYIYLFLLHIMIYYLLFCVIDFQSYSSEYVCAPSTSNEQLLAMPNDICDSNLGTNMSDTK